MRIKTAIERFPWPTKKQHFDNLLGNHPKVTHETITKFFCEQLDIKQGQLREEELDSVLRKILNRKASELDEIPSEHLKNREFNDILLRHCNAVYNQSTVDRWMKGCILPFPKKSGVGLAKGYITYIHSGQNIQFPPTKPHRTQNWQHC